MLGFSHTRVEAAIIFSILFETPYRFESVRVCVCGFIFPSHYLKIFFFFSFFFCIFWSNFGKATCKKFSRLFFLFVSNLFSQPSFYISNISLTFCLRISLICVGGCLVCVLIFFFSIYYIFFFSLSSSLDLFFI